MDRIMTFKLLLEVILYLALITGLIIGAIIIIIKKIGAVTESLTETHCYKQRENDMEKRRAEYKRRMEEKKLRKRKQRKEKIGNHLEINCIYLLMNCRTMIG